MQMIGDKDRIYGSPEESQDQKWWTYILAVGDETDNENIEDSDEECEDYCYVVQLGCLLHVLIHLDVQRSLCNEAKTDKDLIIKVRVTMIPTSVV